MVAEEDSLPGRDEALGFYLKYDAKEVLGRGVSSVVRRCVCKESGMSYAVKIIDISQNHINADGLDMVEQVHQEINILRLVGGHPNVIDLIEYFESPTYIFLVFELCQQGELFDYLSRNVRLSEKKCRMIMRQVFSAVIHCHQLGIVHRDLKPENILLDDDFNIKLTDFGFARKLQTGERLYETVGTPGYLAPEVLTAGMFEQDECNGYGFEVDAWACGVIMYTLLIGRPPFWHRKQMMLIRQIMRGEYTMIGPDWAEVTAETKDLISKLLVVDDTKRLTVAGALNHEVFRAQRFSRSGCPMTLSVDNRTSFSKQSSTSIDIDDVDNLKLNGPTSSLPPQVPMVILDSGVQDGGKVVQLYSPVFNAKQTFKISIMCVRFLIRLLKIKTTPELLSLKKTQINPYCMRSYRKTIDSCAFTIYSHWVKKGEGQNRAAVFQNFVKQDKRKKDKMDKTLLRP